MKNCPECGTAVDGLVCPQCQYRDPAAGFELKATLPVSVVDRLCVHVERGLRCARIGTITPNIHGPADGKGPHPGPWFCSDHMPGLARPVSGTRPAGFTYPVAKPIVTTFKRIVDVEDISERIAIQAEGHQGEQDRPT